MNEINNIKQSFDKVSSTPLYDLQEVIQQYQSQPELLKLILTSKVEEDKRKAEEAKLRAKELDLYLKKDNNSNELNIIESNSILKKKTSYHSKSSNNNNNNNLRGLPYIIPKSRSYHSSTFSLSSLSEEELDEDKLNNNNIDNDSTLDHQQRRHSAAAAMLAMGTIETNQIQLNEKESDKQVISSAYPSPIADQYNDEKVEDDSKPRRRREMQAITKIVETRDFPYIDNYFWKNNGNTVQKKTGCKSIYYKCSNSNKGCTVNKTVTAKPNGEYLIKYRGCHLIECGRVERIRDL